MYHFYTPPETIKDNKIIIQNSQTINHIKNVLRLKIKDEVSVFDGKGNEYIGNIGAIDKGQITVNIKTRHKPDIKRKSYVAVACAIPKRARFDALIDKLTQLAVDEIIPLNTQRTIVKKDHRERWKKLAISACEQSQRSNLPKISALIDFKDALSRVKEFDLAIIPTLSGKREDLKRRLFAAKAKRVLVFIGPEGDFTPDEVELAKRSGCVPVSFGDLVLKVDTAAIYIASILRYADI